MFQVPAGQLSKLVAYENSWETGEEDIKIMLVIGDHRE